MKYNQNRVITWHSFLLIVLVAEAISLLWYMLCYMFRDFRDRSIDTRVVQHVLPPRLQLLYSLNKMKYFTLTSNFECLSSHEVFISQMGRVSSETENAGLYGRDVKTACVDRIPDSGRILCLLHRLSRIRSLTSSQLFALSLIVGLHRGAYRAHSTGLGSPSGFPSPDDASVHTCFTILNTHSPVDIH